MQEISLVTVSRGRLHHIRQTLPLMVAQGADDVIVVDYGCPDKTGDWVEANFPGTRVVRVDDDPGFCAGRARNLGARQARGDWLAFVDADIKTRPGWISWMRGNLQSGHFYLAAQTPGKRDPDIFGTAVCARADFEAIGGYDEAIRGWGGEDSDLYRSLEAIRGTVRSSFPKTFVSAIRHGDEERANLAGMGNKAQRVALDLCYSKAKLEIMGANGRSGSLTLAERVKLREQTQQMLQQWYANGSEEPLSMEYVLKKDPARVIPAGHTMEAELTLRITLRDIPRPRK